MSLTLSHFATDQTVLVFGGNNTSLLSDDNLDASKIDSQYGILATSQHFLLGLAGNDALTGGAGNDLLDGDGGSSS